jgi:hypothetical protein
MAVLADTDLKTAKPGGQVGATSLVLVRPQFHVILA